MVPASFSGTTKSANNLPVTVQIKLKDDATNTIIEKVQFLVSIDYTCPDPPVGVELADKTFEASNELNYDIKLGSEFTDKECVVEFGIYKVYEVKASDIELSTHPFSIDDPGNLNGIIRLKGTDP